MKTLKDAKVGDIVTVRRLHGGSGEAPHHGYRHHQRRAAARAQGGSLGDPMELNVRGYELSVRKADAQMIELEVSVLMPDG